MITKPGFIIAVATVLLLALTGRDLAVSANVQYHNYPNHDEDSDDSHEFSTDSLSAHFEQDFEVVAEDGEWIGAVEFDEGSSDRDNELHEVHSRRDQPLQMSRIGSGGLSSSLASSGMRGIRSGEHRFGSAMGRHRAHRRDVNGGIRETSRSRAYREANSLGDGFVSPSARRTHDLERGYYMPSRNTDSFNNNNSNNNENRRRYSFGGHLSNSNNAIWPSSNDRRSSGPYSRSERESYSEGVHTEIYSPDDSTYFGGVGFHPGASMDMASSHDPFRDHFSDIFDPGGTGRDVWFRGNLV